MTTDTENGKLAAELAQAKAELKLARKEAEEKQSSLEKARKDLEDAIESKAKIQKQALERQESAKAELETLKNSLGEAEAAKETALAEQKAKFATSMIESEAKSKLTACGAISPEDTIRLMDLSDVKYNDETGSIEGLEELISDVRTNKAFMFKDVDQTAANTGTSSVPPSANTKVPAPAGGKNDLSNMTKDQLDAAWRAEMEAARSQRV